MFIKKLLYIDLLASVLGVAMLELCAFYGHNENMEYVSLLGAAATVMIVVVFGFSLAMFALDIVKQFDAKWRNLK